MKMGDVANHVGDDNSNVLRVARFFNTLNTKSDNMFKRAIFAREMNKALLAGGFEDGLNGLLKTGRFGDVDEKMIGSAMEQALDFTYQTSKFRGKEGIFNQAKRHIY